MFLKNALEFLTDRPSIGISAGLGSGVLANIQSVLMDDQTLKTVSAFGIWFGVIVAGLTIVLKCIEIIDTLKSKFKRNKNEKRSH